MFFEKFFPCVFFFTCGSTFYAWRSRANRARPQGRRAIKLICARRAQISRRAHFHRDNIIIDCLPSFGLLSFNAMAAADEIIIPVRPDYISSVGVIQLFDWINNVKSNLNAELKIAGILITMEEEKPPKPALPKMRKLVKRNLTDIGKYLANAEVEITEDKLEKVNGLIEQIHELLEEE